MTAGQNRQTGWTIRNHVSNLTLDACRSCVKRVHAKLANQLRLAERAKLGDGGRESAERTFDSLRTTVELVGRGEEAITVILQAR